jgi:hypothetical protein
MLVPAADQQVEAAGADQEGVSGATGLAGKRALLYVHVTVFGCWTEFLDTHKKQ